VRVVGSIVLYKNPVGMVEGAISSFLENFNDREVILIDHSPNNDLENLARKNVHYYHNPSNPGYGAGHNLGFQKANDPDYFFIINPDVLVHHGALSYLIQKLKINTNIGLITGKVLNVDGTLQKLLKNDATVTAFIARRITALEKISYFSKAVENFVIEAEFYEKEWEVPIISGCFMGIRGEIFKKVGGFDERYFLYFEDFDLCRKIRSVDLKILYEPRAEITHYWNRGAHKSLRHLWYFVKSLYQYFNKWGWRF
jgi:GT2 family glycosyltransferase